MKTRAIIQSLTVFLLVGCEVLYSMTKKAWLLICITAAMFLLVGMLQSFHGHESIAIFFVALLAVIPLNIVWIPRLRLLPIFWLFDSDNVLWRGLWAVVLFLLMFSVEEIAVGVLGRLIWPEQQGLNEVESSPLNVDAEEKEGMR